MNISKSESASLRFVSMPIIRLMRSGDLSWADLEACADALLSIRRHHDGMESERKGFAIAAQSQAQGVSGHVGRGA